MVERIVVGTLQTNCYIYSADQKTCTVIDPGGDVERIAMQLEAFGVVPRFVVLTHGHFDHVAGLKGLLEHCEQQWGEKPEVLIHKADRRYLGASGRARNMRDLQYLGIDTGGEIARIVDALPRADRALSDGEAIGDTGLAVLATPGHSPGSICLYQEERGILFSGDTLFAQGIGRADLPDGSETKLLKSIKERLYVLPGETSVYPGHGPFTSIEREAMTNPFVTLED